MLYDLNLNVQLDRNVISPLIAHFEFSNVVLRNQESKKEKWQSSQNLHLSKICVFCRRFQVWLVKSKAHKWHLCDADFEAPADVWLYCDSRKFWGKSCLLYVNVTVRFLINVFFYKEISSILINVLPSKARWTIATRSSSFFSLKTQRWFFLRI